VFKRASDSTISIHELVNVTPTGTTSKNFYPLTYSTIIPSLDPVNWLEPQVLWGPAPPVVHVTPPGPRRHRTTSGRVILSLAKKWHVSSLL